MNIVTRSLCVGLVVSTAVILSSCGGRTSAQSGGASDISPLPCVVVVPTSVPYGEQEEGYDVAEEEMRRGALVVDDAIMAALQESSVPRVVESDQLRLDISEIAGGKPGGREDIGRASSCDYVLSTILIHFLQRQGGEYAVDSPASAAFEMHLQDASTGKSLWTASFRETQTSLMHNLLTFRKAQSRGFKWITVEELVTRGVQEKLRENPYLY